MKMVLLFFIFSELVFSQPGTKSSIEPLIKTKEARMAYVEFVPNSSKTLVIQALKCDPNKNELSLKKFQAKEKVLKGIVNIITIIADAGHCKTSLLSSVWSEKVLVPQNGWPTHVYMTLLSDRIMILNND